MDVWEDFQGGVASLFVYLPGTIKSLAHFITICLISLATIGEKEREKTILLGPQDVSVLHEMF